MATSPSNGLSPRVKDLTGRVFGLLTVLRYHGSGPAPHHAALWACRCDCDASKEFIALGTTLTRKHCRSCGCYRKANMRRIAVRHGMAASSEYGIWLGVKKRTGDKNNVAYERYGGRGITMCDRWRDSFETFYKDMGPRPTNRHTLERKDNSMGYAPENCVWATYQEQARNRRSNRILTFRGESMPAIAWAERYGMEDQVLCRRLKKGWSIEKSLTEPVRCYKKAPYQLRYEAEDLLTG